MLKSFILSLLLFITAYSCSAATFFDKEYKADEVFFTLSKTTTNLSLEDYVKLKPSDLKKLTGHRRSLKEIIVFKITQKRIKKTIRRDGTVDMLAFKEKGRESFRWHWGRFFLDLLLPVAGMVIAAFIKDDKKKTEQTVLLLER